MFRLDIYMEKWAMTYKGMLHTEENPRFFRCNSEFTVDQFLNEYQDMNEPVCGIVTHLEGAIDVPKRINRPKYSCLFMARADPDNYKEQADAKYKCFENAYAFLVKLDYDRQMAARESRTNPLSAIDLSDITYDMIGPVASNGWFELIVTLKSSEHTPGCYSPEDYIE